MDAEDGVTFTSEEMTRIYREAAATAEDTCERLRVLLAPYTTAEAPSPRHRGDS